MLSRQDYIDNILDHHDHPRNKRKLEPADIDASGGNPGCGDVVVMYANVDATGRIAEASFQGEGCTISQAAASMLTEKLVGKSLGEVVFFFKQKTAYEMGKEVVSSRAR